MSTPLRLTSLLLSSLILTILLTTAALSGAHTLLLGSAAADGSRGVFIALVTVACSVSALLGVWHVSSCVVAVRHARRRASSPSASHLPRWLAPAVRRTVGGTVALSLSAAPAFAAHEPEGSEGSGGASPPIVAVQVLSPEEDSKGSGADAPSEITPDAESEELSGSNSESAEPDSGQSVPGKSNDEKPASDNPGSGAPSSDRPAAGPPSSERPDSGQPGSGNTKDRQSTAENAQADAALPGRPQSSALGDLSTHLAITPVHVLPPTDELDAPRILPTEPEPTPPLSPIAVRHSPAWPLLRYGRAGSTSEQYVVREGESLWSITEKLWGSGKHRETQEAEIAQA